MMRLLGECLSWCAERVRYDIIIVVNKRSENG